MHASNFLRVAQVGELRLGAALVEELALLLAQAEAPADEPRLVRVEDAAVLRPHLHADDRAAEDLRLHDVVELRDRPRRAAQEPVGEPGELDELALREHALLRVARRLVDRHGPQREEPADDDHRDRGEAAQHEAQHGRGGAGRAAPGARA